MPYKDLREAIDAIDKKGELVRISSSFDRDLQISEAARRVMQTYGPALFFENVSGFESPVLINLFGSPHRISYLLGVENLHMLSAFSESLLELVKHPPTGIVQKLKALWHLKEMSHALPKIVSDGPCKEVIIKDNPSLDRFPILKCWPEDGGRFVTYPLVFTRDPDTGWRNCGIYRMQVYDGRTTGMHWHMHKHGALHYGKMAAKGVPLEVAVAIGADPAILFAAAVPLPAELDEMVLAGLIRGKGVEMVRCETVALEVPASAEIVLEGYVPPHEKRLEGPFGDHTGFYSLPDEYPVFHINCITHRKKPVYHATVVGPPPMEDCVIGKAIERLLLPFLKLQIPEIVDVNIPAEGVFHNLMIVSIKKAYPGHARKVMHALWGMGQAMFSKVIVVTDDDVDVQNISEVIWKVLNNIDPQRDLEFVMGPIDVLDHASRARGYGSKVGIDATRKGKEEGFYRDWPRELKMPPEVITIVTEKLKGISLGCLPQRHL